MLAFAVLQSSMWRGCAWFHGMRNGFWHGSMAACSTPMLACAQGCYRAPAVLAGLRYMPALCQQPRGAVAWAAQGPGSVLFASCASMPSRCRCMSAKQSQSPANPQLMPLAGLGARCVGGRGPQSAALTRLVTDLSAGALKPALRPAGSSLVGHYYSGCGLRAFQCAPWAARGSSKNPPEGIPGF